MRREGKGLKAVANSALQGDTIASWGVVGHLESRPRESPERERGESIL